MTKTTTNDGNDSTDGGKHMGDSQPPAGPGIVLGTMLWGLLFGLAGFLGGFFGPIIFRPGSPQGPLVGIFITGPLGVIIGCLYGAKRTLRKR